MEQLASRVLAKLHLLILRWLRREAVLATALTKAIKKSEESCDSVKFHLDSRNFLCPVELTKSYKLITQVGSDAFQGKKNS